MPNTATGTTRDLSTLAGRMGAAWDALRGQAFGPGAPIAPTTSSNEQDAGARQWQYPIGANTQTAPRGDAPSLTPFQQLRNLARLYPPAAICVRTRIEEFQGLQWSVVAKNKRRQAELQELCDRMETFWSMPDRHNEFASWLAIILREALEIDALTLYIQRDQLGRVHALEAIDGSTIKPLLDDRGHIGGYQQVLYGLPFNTYGKPGDTTQPHQLIYRPRMPRADSPYGLPPTEDIIMNVNMGLRKMNQDLAHFTDGNIPRMLIAPPEGKLDPKQVAEFERYFNAVLAGNDAARTRAKFLPWNANVKELDSFTYETTLDLWMLQITFAAFGVPPQEAGFTQDINRATAESQQNVNERRGLKPLALWLKGMFDRVIQAPKELGGFNCPQLEWQWNFGEAEDKKSQADTDKIYAGLGVVSAAELRTMRFGDQLDGPPPAPPAAPMQPGGTPQEAPAQPGHPFGKRAADDPPPALTELSAAAEPALDALYAAQARRVIGKLKRQQPIDWKAERAAVVTAIRPVLIDVVTVAAEDALAAAGAPAVDWALINQAALAVAEQRAAAFAAESVATTKSQVARLVAAGIRERLPQKLLLSQVAQTLGRRAAYDAVTEITRVYALGNQRAWQRSKVVKAMGWQTARDDRVCPVCGPRHGSRLDLDSAPDALPPAHGKCRCWLVPEVN